MNADGSKRKLAAIFSADVKGYSRLMEDDEAATVRTLTEYRRVLADAIGEHRGRVVDSPGDNLLAEFASVVDAVQAAMDVQSELGKRNAQLPDQRRMDFRIGINLGDVIEEEGRLYGDGVNVSARIEGLADPGGICLSASAHEQVKTKIDMEGKYLGQFDVKNIAEPVRVWAVLTDATTLASVRARRDRHQKSRRTGLLAGFAVVVAIVAVGLWNTSFQPTPTSEESLIDRSSIAVLPFTNLTGDQTKEFLCDGISEDIINALSQIPKLIVIARQSTFVHKGKASNVQAVGKDLGARYILQGNVRRADNRLRVSAQLIEAETGKSTWAETYDREFTDLFAVQEEITLSITAALQVTITEGLQARLWRKKASNMQAYAKTMQSLEHLWKFNKEDNRLARELAEEAVALDPEWAGALRMLGWTHWSDARFGFSPSPAQSMKMAMDLAQKALTMDDQYPHTYWLLSGIHLMRKEHDQAVDNIRKASEMAPNSVDLLAFKALCLNYSGEPTEALASIQKAMRLNPHYPNWYDGQMGLSYHLLGDHERSLDNYKKMKERVPNSYLPRAMLVIGYVQLKREAAARSEAEDLLKLRPDFTTAIWRRAQPYKDLGLLEKEVQALRDAGLSE